MAFLFIFTRLFLSISLHCLSVLMCVSVLLCSFFSSLHPSYAAIINNLFDSNNARTHHSNNHPTLCMDYKSQHDSDDDDE